MPCVDSVYISILLTRGPVRLLNSLKGFFITLHNKINKQKHFKLNFIISVIRTRKHQGVVEEDITVKLCIKSLCDGLYRDVSLRLQLLFPQELSTQEKERKRQMETRRETGQGFLG